MADTTSINQAHFNKIAHEYDQRYAKTIGQLENELLAKLDILNIKKGGRLLDYACGTGLLSRVLGKHVTECVGVDVSESMVEAFNAKMASMGVAETSSAHVGDLLCTPPTASVSGPKFHDFDAAGVGAGFHHFDDCVLAASRLVERLVPGGVLFIVDFVPHAKNPDHAHVHGVRHHGFSEETMKDVFVKAGAGKDFVYEVMSSEVIFENSHGPGQHMQRQFFMARGTKE